MDPKMLRELSLSVHKHADLDIDKIVAIHDYLVRNTAYDEAAATHVDEVLLVGFGKGCSCGFGYGGVGAAV